MPCNHLRLVLIRTLAADLVEEMEEGLVEEGSAEEGLAEAEEGSAEAEKVEVQPQT